VALTVAVAPWTRKTRGFVVSSQQLAHWPAWTDEQALQHEAALTSSPLLLVLLPVRSVDGVAPFSVREWF